MSILVIIYSKAILIKTIQTTIILFNPFYIIASKHKSILSESILYIVILIISNTHTDTNYQPYYSKELYPNFISIKDSLNELY